MPALCKRSMSARLFSWLTAPPQHCSASALSRFSIARRCRLARRLLQAFFSSRAYELAIERLALTAAARLAAVNLLQFAQVLAYAISVVFVLRAGGGLFGVFACQLGSVLFARILLPLCWQGTRPIAKHMIGTLRPLLARLTGRMGGGYFLSAALILTSQSDVLVIGWLGGAEAAARYVLLWKIAEVGVTALWRISESWSPILVRIGCHE